MDAIDPRGYRELMLLVADPQRWAILQSLEGDGRTVSELVERMAIAQPAVSHHLARLRRAGLVEVIPDGRRRRYVWSRPSVGSAPAELQALLRRWFRAGPVTVPEADLTQGRRAALEVHLL